MKALTHRVEALEKKVTPQLHTLSIGLWLGDEASLDDEIRRRRAEYPEHAEVLAIVRVLSEPPCNPSVASQREE